MGLKSRFINTCGCGAGFPWLLAHTTPICILGHPQFHGPAAGMDIYTTTILDTSTWVPYGCVHVPLHSDMYPGSQHVPRRCCGNLAPLLWLWRTPAPPLARSTPLGCSTPRTWSSFGNLRTSLAALATDGIWRWPKTGPTGCSGYSVLPAGVRILHR